MSNGVRGKSAGRRLGLAALALCALGAALWVSARETPSLVGSLRISDYLGRLGGEGYHIRIALPLPRRDPPPAPAAAGEGARAEGADGKASSEAIPMVNPVNPEQAAEAGAPAGSGDAASRQAAAGLANRTRMLKLNFSIDPASGDGPLLVKKPVHLNGVAKGTAKLKITDSYEILINSADVASLGGADLGEKVMSALAKAEYVKLDSLRSAGLAIRYDAVNDTVLVSSANP